MIVILDAAVVELTPIIGLAAACRLFGRSRAGHYRDSKLPVYGPARPRVKGSPRALTDVERQTVLRNVVTALPYDRIVLERTWKDENIVYASPAQIAMDCLTGFGRMPAEADALLGWMRQRAPRWQAPSLQAAATMP